MRVASRLGMLLLADLAHESLPLWAPATSGSECDIGTIDTPDMLGQNTFLFLLILLLTPGLWKQVRQGTIA